MSEILVTNSTINIKGENDVNIHCEIRYKCLILGALFHSELPEPLIIFCYYRWNIAQCKMFFFKRTKLEKSKLSENYKHIKNESLIHTE